MKREKIISQEEFLFLSGSEDPFSPGNMLNAGIYIIERKKMVEVLYVEKTAGNCNREKSCFRPVADKDTLLKLFKKCEGDIDKAKDIIETLFDLGEYSLSGAFRI